MSGNAPSNASDRRLVSLVSCSEYDLERLQAALERSLEPLGGIGAFVQPGQRVALKPNLLRASKPANAATTDPNFVAAVARLIRQAGGEPFILDSPGGPTTVAYLRTVYRITGMTWAAEMGGARLVEDLAAVQVPHPQGLLLHRVDLVQAAVEADVLINLPKLKTHGLTGLTVAVKNLFGLVPGVVKVGYHSRFQGPRDFSRGLVDIALAANAQLHLLDAVVGMEGNGPSAGNPRTIGAILAGSDPLRVDVAAAALVGLAPRDVLTTDVAAEAGLISGSLADVELVGEPLEALRVRGFVPSETQVAKSTRRALEAEIAGAGDWRSLLDRIGDRLLAKLLLFTPRAGEGCTGCGFCAQVCPVGAITINQGRAHMDPKACIRCYCCHELCPALAVELKQSPIGKAISRL